MVSWLWIQRFNNHQSSFTVKLIELVTIFCKSEWSWYSVGRAFRGKFTRFVNLNLLVIEASTVWNVKYLRLAVLKLIYNRVQFLSGLRKSKYNLQTNQTTVFPPKWKQLCLDFVWVQVNLVWNEFSEEPLTWIVIHLSACWLGSLWNIEVHNSWDLCDTVKSTKITELHMII